MDIPAPVATWSPCCHSLREGTHQPGVMHSGLCRDAHHGPARLGALGPTIRLVVHPDDVHLLVDYELPEQSLHLFTLARRSPHDPVAGCECYRCADAAAAVGPTREDQR
jgi:hypothetical protein